MYQIILDILYRHITSETRQSEVDYSIDTFYNNLYIINIKYTIGWFAQTGCIGRLKEFKNRRSEHYKSI